MLTHLCISGGFIKVSFSLRSVIQEGPLGEGAPIFVLARESTSDRLPSVYTDAAAALEAMGAYLFDKGYGRPPFVGGPTSDSTALRRRRRYREF